MLTWGLFALALPLILALVLLWSVAAAGHWRQSSSRADERREKERRSWRRGALLAVLIAGALTWSNFLTFHGSREVHLWDFMHYYVGSKYFAENDYRWFYHCALLAELDDGRIEEIRLRKYRDLNSNRLGASRLIIAEAESVCRKSFSDQRWSAFRQDLRVFRELMGEDWFKQAFTDHGYNASPAWTMVGSRLGNWAWDRHLPAPDLVSSPGNLEGRNALQSREIRERFDRDRDRIYGKIQWLARIDLALYAAIFGMMTWAFGWRAGALAAAVWAVGHPWAYYWTGGSLGRVPWLLMAVGSLCMMKKGHDAVAGVGLAWPILLRAFPAALAGGLALKFLWNAIHERRMDPSQLRIMAGALAATAVLVSASMADLGGPEAYTGFASNSVKHRSTPLTNHMGLQTLVSYDPSYSARRLRDSASDPFAKWKEMRRTLLSERKVVVAALWAGMVLLLGYVVRRMENWEATSLSVVLVFGVFELTGYYASYLILLAPFCVRKTRDTVALLAMAIGTQVAFLLTDWEDERALLQSLLVLAALLFVLVGEALEQRRHGLAARLEPASET